MLKMCGDTEEKLAQELIQFEFQIERDVVEPLYVLAEVSHRCCYLMHQFKHYTFTLQSVTFFISSLINRK